VKSLRRLAFALLLPASIPAVLLVADVYADRQYRVAVVAPVPLYTLPPHKYPLSNPVLATLAPGQALRVLRVRYGKDFEALRVETPDGQVGWVFGGGPVRVLSRGGATAGQPFAAPDVRQPATPSGARR